MFDLWCFTARLKLDGPQAKGAMPPRSATICFRLSYEYS